MLELLPQEQTVGLAFFCLVLYTFIYFLLRPAKMYPYTLPKKRYVFSIVLIIVLCLFYFTVSDWFQYHIEFEEAIMGSNTHMESFYEWLAADVTHNYIVWRLLVWGSALFLILITVKKMPVPPALFLLVFVIMMFTRFAYTRTALAYSIMYLGCMLIFDSNRKKSAALKVFAFALIVSSYFFHKSALFGIVMISIALVIKKVDWKIMLIVVLMIPLLLYIMRNQITQFLMMDFESSESDFGEYMNIGQTYMENQRRQIISISGIIHDILLRGPVIIMAGVCFIQGNNSSIPKEITFFMKLNILMVIAAFVCRFNLGANTYVMFYRFLGYAVLPATFCFSYLYSNKYYPKLLNVIYFWAALGAFYELIYSVYVRYVNGAISF